MTVKELINELLDCRMDANVTVLVEIDKHTLAHTLAKYGDDAYPLDDEIDVKRVDELGRRARIVLQEFKQ